MAKKKLKVGKKAFCLIFAFLLSIESFGAIVNSSDGGAFVTKQEFEDLKKEFDVQIERYNQSIDNKIDGSIARYLSGLRVVKNKELNTIYAPDEGVLSLQSASFPWEEGNMDMSFYGAIYRYSSNTKGYFEFKMTTSNPSNFSETLISNVDYTNGTGEFVGWCKSRQYFVSNGNNAKNYNFQQAGQTQVTGYNGGFFPVSNQELTTYGQLYTIGFHGPNWQSNYWNTNVLECYGQKASFRREIISNVANWTSGLILNSASMTHKFNNKDEYRDWCNDNTTTGHTVATSMDAVGLTGTGTHYDLKPDNTTEVSTAVILTSGECSYSSVASALGTQLKPYLGFVRPVTNWNKIYTGNFDTQLDTILLETDSNANVNTITDSKGKKHLKLGAGLPVIEAKNEDKIKYRFEFKDKTKDYLVWVKEGSFDSTKDLTSSYSACIKDFEIDDGTTTFDSDRRALVIKNGVGEAKFEVESENTVIYIKWSNYGSAPNNGGGILIPAKRIVVESP